MVHLRAFSKFLFKRYKATVLDDIWPELFFFTGVAVSELHSSPEGSVTLPFFLIYSISVVCCVNEFTNTNLAISNQMLTVVGTVLGLVVSFRTSSAYDRYVSFSVPLGRFLTPRLDSGKAESCGLRFHSSQEALRRLFGCTSPLNASLWKAPLRSQMRQLA